MTDAEEAAIKEALMKAGEALTGMGARLTEIGIHMAVMSQAMVQLSRHLDDKISQKTG